MTVLPALKKKFLMRCLIASFKEFLQKEMEDFGLFLGQYALSFGNGNVFTVTAS